MEKTAMDQLLLSHIHVVILVALLSFTRGKSFVESSSSSSHPNDTVTYCITSERSALVGFKAGLSDANLLSSWKGDECCNWKGVHCSSRNNHVIKLDLSGHRCDSSDDAVIQVLGGNISSSLLGLRHLRYLNLSCNDFDGVQLPEFLGSLHKLRYIDLSMSNFSGKIPSQLGNLSNLRYLNLNSGYSNSTYSTDITWLSQLTSLVHLDLSNTNLSTIVHWLWIMASTVETLNMRYNKISGTLPSTMEFMRATIIDLSSNQFNGIVPKLPTSLTDLDLSRNHFGGPLPLDFGAPSLRRLILFRNNISGTIPSSLCKLRSLVLLDFSENKLSGSVPDCSAHPSTTNKTAMSILNLSLRNNNLSGEFPSFLQYCQKLIFLDLSHNHFFGTLPTWIGERMPILAFLRLRSNMFYGHIPEELTKLVNLQYLDLANNKITGSIPKSIVNFKWMMLVRNGYKGFHGLFHCSMSIGLDDMITYTDNFTVVTKGQERLYTGEIVYMVNLDLSCNNLIGDIPKEIATLLELKNLNLSWNTFRGNIPGNIGALVEVESLDLSHNKLSGEIPTSLSALTSLSHLNLSYNSLTGEVPSGDQLRTLENPEYIYIGNPGLCGPPLSQNCSQAEIIPAMREHREDLSDKVSCFVAMGSGYVMGLWVVFCTFLFKRKWRVKWYSVCDRFYDWVFVLV